MNLSPASYGVIIFEQKDILRDDRLDQLRAWVGAIVKVYIY